MLQAVPKRFIDDFEEKLCHGSGDLSCWVGYLHHNDGGFVEFGTPGSESCS